MTAPMQRFSSVYEVTIIVSIFFLMKLKFIIFGCSEEIKMSVLYERKPSLLKARQTNCVKTKKSYDKLMIRLHIKKYCKKTFHKAEGEIFIRSGNVVGQCMDQLLQVSMKISTAESLMQDGDKILIDIDMLFSRNDWSAAQEA
ncbi:hypothetical protein CAPTEDRAFT_203229 [Capitella teleta]|uniref:Uncharacterized protein n=1 Tax=Capitella teleta TaxID=283909 RepID=R7TT94_CAPTE|nr:hypothetical protein CAPTEDRAFT_203229 [Capitella teleta]|eukprot:ELT96864.1 hypothetical protein CAPTEDRAFT_203229 [Capitella teleta]